MTPTTKTVEAMPAPTLTLGAISDSAQKNIDSATHVESVVKATGLRMAKARSNHNFPDPNDPAKQQALGVLDYRSGPAKDAVKGAVSLSCLCITCASAEHMDGSRPLSVFPTEAALKSSHLNDQLMQKKGICHVWVLAAIGADGTRTLLSTNDDWTVALAGPKAAQPAA